MTISESGWMSYIDRLAAINNTAARKFVAFLNTHETATAEGRKLALDYAAALVQKYGESAAAVACEMYDAVAEASGVMIPAAEPAAVATYGEVAKTVSGIMKQSGNPEYVGSGVSRLVKQAGVDTTVKNAIRDGAEWAWVPHGDTCSFCIMLASNGWQEASKKVLKGDHAEHVHANCDCTFAVRFDSRTNVAGYDPDALYEQYMSAEGDTWQEKLNSMRREQYAANPEKYRAQKRAAYDRAREYVSVIKKNRDSATPGVGKFEIEVGRVSKNQEESNARLIYKEFGGDITMLKEDNTPGAHNPDYRWKGKDWEEQEPKSHSKNAIDANIREAIHQIAENPGGIVLDIGNSEMDLSEVNAIALHRLRRSSPYDCDVMVIRNGRIEDVRHYRRIKK